jgi:hypothetical protein
MSFSGQVTTNSTTIVSNDGWWPDLGVADFQARYRLPQDYAEEVLVDGLQLAMAWANRQLSTWRATDTAAVAAANLDAVDAPQLGDESVLLIHYRRAVFSHAKAYAMRQFPTIDRRDTANNEAKEGPDTEAKFLEYAQQAIADFLGVGRICVELL